MIRSRVLRRRGAGAFLAAWWVPMAGCFAPLLPRPQAGGGADNLLSGGSPQGGGADGSQAGDELLGLFVARLGGSIEGQTYLEVRNGPAEDEHLITTISGAGFRVGIDSAGTITILGMNDESASAGGEGNVIGEDSFVLTATVAGSAWFPDGEVAVEASRISGTEASFPLAVSPAASSVLVNQVFAGSITRRDPAGGGLESTLAGQQIFVNSTGSGATIRLPSGEEFTAVFYEPLRAVVRVVAGGQGAFGTLAGSATNTGMDVVGRVDFDDVNNFTATLALQSPDPLGGQSQEVIALVGSTTLP